MTRTYRRALSCTRCAAYVDARTCELSWFGQALCDPCVRLQGAPNVARARRVVGGPLATRGGHLALAAHALGRAGAVGAAGVVVGLVLLLSGAEEARRGSLLVLSFGLLLIAFSFVTVEDAALERWKHLIPRTRRRPRRDLTRGPDAAAPLRALPAEDAATVERPTRRP